MRERKSRLTSIDRDLIRAVGGVGPESREFREKMVEIQLHDMRTTEHATNGLRYATWVLAACTLVLVFTTLVK